MQPPPLLASHPHALSAHPAHSKARYQTSWDGLCASQASVTLTETPERSYLGSKKAYFSP